MLLTLSAWPEIESYLTRSTGIVIPIGSIEQHGPNGYLGTDALCPEIIAKAATEHADILVGPTFSVGVAQHHLGFPGTLTLRPSTMIAVLEDWVNSLIRHGFRRFYFLNGHGGNVATIEAAFAEIYGRFSFAGDAAPIVLRRRNWWEFREVDAVGRKLFPRGMGSHATPSEVAVTYAAYPEAMKSVVMKPKIAPTGPIRDAADYRGRFPDGRIGSNPALATPDAGKEIIAVAARAVAAEAEQFFTEGTTAAVAAE